MDDVENRFNRKKFMTSGTQEFNADVLSISLGLFVSFLTLKINQSRGKPYELSASCTATSRKSKA